MSAGQIESFCVEHVIDRLLDAGGLGEIGVELHVGDLVEHFFGVHDGVESAPASAKTAEGDWGDLDSEASRRWSGDAQQDGAEVLDFVYPFEEGILLVRLEFVKESVSTLELSHGFD